MSCPDHHRTRWPEFVAAGATLAAVVFVGVELRRTRLRAERDRRLELDAVAVSWRTPASPGRPDEDGAEEWRYEFTAHNPGRLPISDLRLEITFPLEVRRVRYDGALGKPDRVVRLAAPVLAGGYERSWHRTLRMSHQEARALLAQTTATITFRDAEGVTRTNAWPRTLDRSPDRAQ